MVSCETRFWHGPEYEHGAWAWRQQLLAQMLSAALARVHFCVRQTQHLFWWPIERLQSTERAVSGCCLAMSDTDVFPGRPRVGTVGTLPPAGSWMICGYAGTSGLYGWLTLPAALCLRRLPGHSLSMCSMAARGRAAAFRVISARLGGLKRFGLGEFEG